MKKNILLLIVIIIGISANAQNYKRYAFKSGIIEYKYEGKTTGTEILYFDDYGKREAKYSNTVTKMFGVKSYENTITILNGDQVTIYDEKTGKATKSTNQAIQAFSTDEDMDYEEFAIKMMKSLGFEKVGTETVLGKNCDVWEGIGTIYTWKGLSIKTITKIMGIKINIIATDVQTNVRIPASKFELPGGVEIKTMNNFSDDENNPEGQQNMESLKSGLNGLFTGDKRKSDNLNVNTLSRDKQSLIKVFTSSASRRAKFGIYTYATFEKSMSEKYPDASKSEIKDFYNEIKKIVKELE
jgi:hypothetical protein